MITLTTSLAEQQYVRYFHLKMYYHGKAVGGGVPRSKTLEYKAKAAEYGQLMKQLRQDYENTL